MKLASIMKESLIFPEIVLTDKNEVLKMMTQEIAKEFPDLNAQELYSMILERERLSSTGIGSGIAIPHAKISKAKHHIAAFGRSRIGIPFDSIDSKLVHLIFLLIGPVGANEAHLKALARISKFLHDTAFRERLYTAQDASLIYEAIVEKDAQY